MSEPTSLSHLRELSQGDMDAALQLAKRFIAAGEREPDLPEWHQFTQQLARALLSVATSHNALPALLEIAEAAMRWRDAYHAGQLTHGAAINALLAALDKVKA